MPRRRQQSRWRLLLPDRRRRHRRRMEDMHPSMLSPATRNAATQHRPPSPSPQRARHLLLARALRAYCLRRNRRRACAVTAEPTVAAKTKKRPSRTLNHPPQTTVSIRHRGRHRVRSIRRACVCHSVIYIFGLILHGTYDCFSISFSNQVVRTADRYPADALLINGHCFLKL